MLKPSTSSSQVDVLTGWNTQRRYAKFLHCTSHCFERGDYMRIVLHCGLPAISVKMQQIGSASISIVLRSTLSIRSQTDVFVGFRSFSAPKGNLHPLQIDVTQPAAGLRPSFSLNIKAFDPAASSASSLQSAPSDQLPLVGSFNRLSEASASRSNLSRIMSRLPISPLGSLNAAPPSSRPLTRVFSEKERRSYRCKLLSNHPQTDTLKKCIIPLPSALARSDLAIR